MALYESWKQLANMAQTPQAQQAFWGEYFAAETENYKKLLADTSAVYEGKLSELAEQFGMKPVVFCGFLDGINTSLTEALDVEALEEDSDIALHVDWEKLYYNMHDAKADWLYNLPEWDGVLSEEKRREITRAWRLSGQAVSEKTVGRNDPCPCGSGKKYKKCCGK